MQARDVITTGKAKTLYATDDPDLYIMRFRDDTSAFDGEKVERLANKGSTNNKINRFIMQHLQANGITTHFVEQLSDRDSLVYSLDMIPIECVVRNIAAGSLCRRLGIEQGTVLTPPIFENFYKDDALHDPMITPSHALTFGWATESELALMEQISLQVNQCLTALFDSADILLVDYKLEFGRRGEQIILADEFSPDGCRLWDKQTHDSLDKDRFRKDMGNVIESYQMVAQRLGIE